MTDKSTKTTDSPLEQHVDENRRKLIKLTLGGAALYSLPLMTSFSMEGLSLGGVAKADSGWAGNMCSTANQIWTANQTCGFNDIPTAKINKKNRLRVKIDFSCDDPLGTSVGSTIYGSEGIEQVDIEAVVHATYRCLGGTGDPETIYTIDYKRVQDCYLFAGSPLDVDRKLLLYPPRIICPNPGEKAVIEYIEYSSIMVTIKGVCVELDPVTTFPDE